MTGPMGRHGAVGAVVAALVLCAWCGWVSGFHRATPPARITWVCSLAAVVAVNVLLWRGRRGRRLGWSVAPVGRSWPTAGRGALVGVLPWLALAVAAATWDVLGLLTGPHQPHLTISALSQAFRPLNAALLAVWMLVGVGYGLARARAPLLSDRSHRQAPGGAGTSHGGAAVAPAAAVHLAPAAAVHLAASVALLLPDNRAVGVAFWLSVAAVGIAIELVARRSAGRFATAEQLMRFITARRAANLVLVAAWIYAGYHLFAN